MIPSVDIRRGRCVQMVGGRPESERVYGDPVEQALRWEAEGADRIHVVDLDAAMGTGSNFIRVAEILASVRVSVQVGGGIRTPERACELLGLGASQVILGTAPLRNPKFLQDLMELVGSERLIVALDSRSGKVVIDGWKTQTERSVLELAREYERMGVRALLFTSVDVEGSMRGVAAREIAELVSVVKIPVIASGGVGSLEDVRMVREAGAAGLVIGKALYEGRFTLRQAMEVASHEGWES